MNVIKKCPLCDDVLEFQDEDRVIWNCLGHDRAPYTEISEFCLTGIKERISLLEKALASQQEVFEQAAKSLCRRVNEMLEKNGLSSLDQRAEDARVKSECLKTLMIGIHPSIAEYFK